MGDYPFGVSGQYGLDNFAQVMRGIQQTMTVIVIVGVISTLIGAVLGAIAGFYRGLDRLGDHAAHRPDHHPARSSSSPPCWV